MRGRIIRILCLAAGVGIIGIYPGSGAAFAARVKLPFVFNGTGAGLELTASCNGTPVLGTTCNGTSNSNDCSCYEATGSGKGTVVGAVSFDNKILVFNSPTPTFGACAYVTGLLTLTSPNQKNILALDYFGQECLGPSTLVVNGTWSTDDVDSAGKFATANGGGTLIGNDDGSGNVFGNVNGTLTLP